MKCHEPSPMQAMGQVMEYQDHSTTTSHIRQTIEHSKQYGAIKIYTWCFDTTGEPIGLISAISQHHSERTAIGNPFRMSVNIID
jgi:hypothetical protein